MKDKLDAMGENLRTGVELGEYRELVVKQTAPVVQLYIMGGTVEVDFSHSTT